MTEDIKNETNADGQPDEKVVMQIILTKEGLLKVGGVVASDKIAALGILEMAKLTLIKAWDAAEVKIHKPNSGGIMGFVRNGRG